MRTIFLISVDITVPSLMRDIINAFSTREFDFKVIEMYSLIKSQIKSIFILDLKIAF